MLPRVLSLLAIRRVKLGGRVNPFFNLTKTARCPLEPKVQKLRFAVNDGFANRLAYFAIPENTMLGIGIL